MLLRCKKSKVEFNSSEFNIHALCEVLTGDDSVSCQDLDAFVGGKWKDFLQCFRDRDIIPNNFNTSFSEPATPEDKERGYYD